jgi:small GTP-binding protein
MGDNFNPYEQNTVGANWHLFAADLGTQRIELQIWDTAGQERYRALGPLYYRNAVAAILVYDVTSRQSFQNLPLWLEAFAAVAGSETLVFVVGNKADLAEGREVPREEAEEWARDKGYEFYETSAKTAQGIRQLFHRVAEKVGGLPRKAARTRTVARMNAIGCC